MNRLLAPNEFAALRRRLLALLYAACLLVPYTPTRGEETQTLESQTIVHSGSTSIMISKGTTVQLLEREDTLCVIAVTLPDGTPLITQIPASSIASTPPHQAGDATSAPKTSQSPAPLSVHGQKTVSNSVKDTQSLAQEGLSDAPAYPQVEFPPVSPDAVLPPVRYTVQTGTFQLPLNGTSVNVVFDVPIDDGRLAESASNLVFYAPYPNELTKLDGNIVPDIVRKLGCSIYSFQFEGFGSAASVKPYWSRDAGWFEVALQARKVLIGKFSLERRKLILMGYSGGAGMAMNFAGAYPDQVEAVAVQAPNVVPPFPEGNKIKWLMVANRGDTNRQVMKPFYDRLIAEKCDALYCETTPERDRGNYHAPSDQTFSLIYSYIAGVLEQRRHINDDDNSFDHLWPYAAPASPLRRYAISRTSAISPEDLNNGRYNLLPSLAFAMNWSHVCAPEQRVRVDNDHALLTLNYPARATPAGIILYYDNPAYSDIPREVEDISSLAEHGYLVISTMTASPDSFVSAASTWIKGQDQLNGLRLHVIGNGEPGARFVSKVIERDDISFRSVCILDFGNAWLDVKCDDQVTSAAKECGMYGFYSYSDSKFDSDLKDWATGLVDKGAEDRGCFNVCSKRLEADSSDDPERRERAEDQALSLVKSLLARADAQ